MFICVHLCDFLPRWGNFPFYLYELLDINKNMLAFVKKKVCLLGSCATISNTHIYTYNMYHIINIYIKSSCAIGNMKKYRYLLRCISVVTWEYCSSVI